MLAQEAKRLKAERGGFYICSMKVRVKAQLDQYYVDQIGEDYFFTDPNHAIATLTDGLDSAFCQRCRTCVFLEQMNCSR